MALSFRTKMSITIGISCLLATTAAVVVASRSIEHEGEAGLIMKSQAILSRLEVGREYVAGMDVLKTVVDETLRKFPDGNLPEEQKLKILKAVPVFAAFKLGKNGSEAEHYEFRVAADAPRRKENAATPEEAARIKRFNDDKNLQEIVETSADGKHIIVTRPVRISEAQGCLTCHGHPSTSPWKNGKDILGYRMEDLKDGDLRGTFSVISSLAPVKEATSKATWMMIGFGVLFTLVSFGIGFLIMRGGLFRLTSVGTNLKKSNDELMTVIQQVSQVSQTLSDSSSKAAASLEETAASVQELDSMVKQNAENSKQASLLSRECQTSADKGEKEIGELVKAMDGITESSSKIGEITNVIDDIAFQTNLLALNAAVEAARAGEQGKGFAVVAEAVRSLAQRSSAAAKEISELIKDSSQRVQKGADIATQSGRALADIVNSVKKVVDLNNEIAAASTEQATGIGQISKAMQELDRTTQQNASSSEESSAAAEVMATEARQLEGMVLELNAVLTGGESHNPPAVDPGHRGHTNGKGGNGTVVAMPKRKPRGSAEAEAIIPMASNQDLDF